MARKKERKLPPPTSFSMPGIKYAFSRDVKSHAIREEMIQMDHEVTSQADLIYKYISILAFEKVNH